MERGINFKYFGKNASTQKVICGGGVGEKHRNFFIKVWKGGKSGVKVVCTDKFSQGIRKAERRAKQVVQYNFFSKPQYL